VQQDYEKFICNIKSFTNIDLSQYKEAQMKRRLTSLRDKKGFENFDTFFQAMKKDSIFLEEFLDKMTINVTEFNRDPKRWGILETKIIPLLLEGKKEIKAWSAACSTGEEPYTLAMLLQRLGIRHKILATDLDEKALSSARSGHYIERSLKEISPNLKARYFVQSGLDYKIHDSLKQHITFQKHNLLYDSYGSGWDLIVCRNVMIYFTDEAKKQIYQKFADSLRPGGILFVGSTEQIFNPNSYGLESVDTFFYRKKV
jgi:chemotaxis protein methyltransferase CheR